MLAPVNLAFNRSTSQLTIQAHAGSHTVREAVTADGFVDLALDGQHHSSNPASASFDRALAGASAATVAGIRFEGGGQDTLVLGSQRLAGAFTVQAVGATVITQNVVTAGPLAVQAPNITVRGAAQGSTISLAASGWVTVDAGGRLDAVPSRGREGSVSVPGTIAVRADVFVDSGQEHAEGPSGGRILVQARNILNAGPITANGSDPGGSGGSVHIAITGSYIATTAAVVSASSAAGPGGHVTIDGGSTGRLYSSGRHQATGTAGGAIDLFGQDVVLAGATADASGDVAGGSVRVGGDFQGRNPVAASSGTAMVTPATTIRADARRTGTGGRVTVRAGQNAFAGVVSARGGSAGGVIDLSGTDGLNYQGSVDLAASKGKAGALLLDPKNLIIADAPASVFPQFDLLDPHLTATGGFGSEVFVLDSGNVVVSNPTDDFGGPNAGAVYLFDGLSGALISSLVGSHPGDLVGGGVQYYPQSPGYSDVTLLSNGNYLVESPYWNGNRGAVTWGNGVTGVSGTVSDANSLVGSNPNDQVGAVGVYPVGNLVTDLTLLGNGDYVVASPQWNDGRGAVTWGNGSTGVSGIVSEANSLIGSNPGDGVGSGIAPSRHGAYHPGVVPLSNGNYVIDSPNWSGGYANGLGAVTWGNGNTGVSGAVTDVNSLVGSNPGDQVGSYGVTALSDGNYVVDSPNWNRAFNGLGAVTWGNGSTGVSGTISETNSLVGSNPGDLMGAIDGLGSSGVTTLSNGNYVVDSPLWNGKRGAVTWGNGGAGVSGTISDANSLVGRSPGDQVGYGSQFGLGVSVLYNGNYVVQSADWNGERGAATWGNGSTGISGNRL
jgi:hypothetical protein